MALLCFVSLTNMKKSKTLQGHWTECREVIKTQKISNCPRDHSYTTLAKGLGEVRKMSYLCLCRVSGWVRKSLKMCWRNIDIVPTWFGVCFRFALKIHVTKNAIQIILQKVCHPIAAKSHLDFKSSLPFLYVKFLRTRILKDPAWLTLKFQRTRTSFWPLYLYYILVNPRVSRLSIIKFTDDLFGKRQIIHILSLNFCPLLIPK